MDNDLMYQLLKRVYSHGGDYSDIYFEESRTTSLMLEDSKVERVVKGIDSGVGIRLVNGGQTSYGYSSNFTPNQLYCLADSVGKTSGSARDINIPSLSGKRSAISFQFKKEPAAVRNILSMMMEANKAARSVSKKIQQVAISYGDISKKVKIVTSDAEVVEETRLYITAFVQVVASDGNVIQTAYEPVGGLIGYELFDEQPFELLAETAARRAVMLLDARPAPSGKMSVIMSSDAGGTMIHEAVGHGLEADLIQGQLSAYAGKMGEQVASPLVTVIDDGTLPNKRGSYLFDDEGTCSNRNTLIEGGVLKSFMYDRTTAAKDKVGPTGNGRRESYRCRPIPRMTNTFILPGNQRCSDIISSLDHGIFVKKMGGGQVNTVNGDFVFEVTEGYMVKNGMISDPVRGATLTGNGPEALKNITMVGADLGYAIGTCGKDGQGVPVSDAQPTILVENLVVGGTAE